MPRRLIALVLIFIGVGIIVGFAGLSLLNSYQPTAGLKIDTDPPALVFINNTQVGTTPLEKTFPPGEATVKLIPTSTSSALTSYQTQIRLTSHTYTVIRRRFSATDSQSEGEIISLYRLPAAHSSQASLSILTSSPESASVSMDNQPQGFTPLSQASLTPGDHQFQFTAPGYLPRSLSAKAIAGYQLTLNLKLAALPYTASTPASPSAAPSPLPSVARPSIPPSPTSVTAPPAHSVTILTTPTGFLRVRSAPSRASAEIGQVLPGNHYPLLESRDGWYLIQVELDSTSSGWISSQYAKPNP